jgi:hypothetical protein
LGVREPTQLGEVTGTVYDHRYLAGMVTESVMKRILIATTQFSEGNDISPAHRLALYEYRDEVDDTPQRWSILLQSRDGTSYGGYFYRTIPIKRFMEKIEENNEHFPKGHHNRIPGLGLIDTDGIAVEFVSDE